MGLNHLFFFGISGIFNGCSLLFKTFLAESGWASLWRHFDRQRVVTRSPRENRRRQSPEVRMDRERRVPHLSTVGQSPPPEGRGELGRAQRSQTFVLQLLAWRRLWYRPHRNTICRKSRAGLQQVWSQSLTETKLPSASSLCGWAKEPRCQEIVFSDPTCFNRTGRLELFISAPHQLH